jgi:hypothetical protein
MVGRWHRHQRTAARGRAGGPGVNPSAGRLLSTGAVRGSLCGHSMKGGIWIDAGDYSDLPGPALAATAVRAAPLLRDHELASRLALAVSSGTAAPLTARGRSWGAASAAGRARSGSD